MSVDDKDIFADSLSHNLLRRISQVSNNSTQQDEGVRRISECLKLLASLFFLAACWMDEARERRKNSSAFAGTENGKVSNEQEILHAYLVNGNLVKNVSK